MAHMILLIQAQIVPIEAKATKNAKIRPLNNFLHSMFNQIDVFFNQKLVSLPDKLYSYRAYSKLLNYVPHDVFTMYIRTFVIPQSTFLSESLRK